MGLFDAFSASDETQNFQQGFKKQKKFAEKGIKYGERYTGQGVDALEAGKEEGLGYLGDTYDTARGDVTQAGADALGRVDAATAAGQGYFDQGMDYLNQGDAGFGYLGQGADTAAGIYDQALAPWQQLSGMGTQGVDAHWNMLQNPDSVFDSELYKSRENAGIEGLNRVANSRGMLASGNNSQDILDYMRQGGLDYFNTLANQYQPYFGMAQNAAAGQANVLGQKAGMYDRLGQNQASFLANQAGAKAGLAQNQGQFAGNMGQYGAGLAQSQGNTLANLASQYGANAANAATGTGQNIANMYGNQGQIGAQAYSGLGGAASDMHTNIANANSAADANTWGAIMGLGNMFTGMYGA
jgi:hypothetical protein